MSNNNIYNILNNFNKIAQDAPAPAATPQAKTKLQESMEQVVNEKYMGFKKVAAAAKAGGAENPEAVAASIGRKKYGKEKFQKAAAAGKKLGEQQDMAEAQQDESALQAYLGKKKYGEQGMKALQKAGREGASKEKMADIRAKHDKMDEVAPPGAKAERMVKHIKKGYTKDGKLSDVEKSKAYGAVWKAHNKGKLDETIKDLLAQGFTQQQIIESWEAMMKDVSKKAKEKGTGKFDKKQISTGTVYTRKYNPKSGETDDTENVSVEKRGRGRPKKSAFENVSTIDKMIAESFGELFENPSTAPVQPKDAAKFMASSDPKMFDKLAGKNAPAAPAPKVGTITKGVWTADAPKPGQAPVPVPQGLDEVDAEMEGMRKLAGLKGGQKKLDKDHDGKLTATDFAMLRKGLEEEDVTTNVPPMPVRINSSNNAMRDAWIEKYGKTHSTLGTPKAPGMTPSDDQSAAEIGRLSNVAGMNAAGKRVPGIPVTKNTSNYAMRDAWMSKYGQSHNADGTPKSMSTNEADMEVDEQLNPALSTPTLDKIAANKAAAVKRGDAGAQADYDKGFAGAYSRDEQGQKKYSDRTAPGVINKIKDTFGLDKPDPAYGPKPAQNTNEADMEEGNAFSGAVAKAKADGVQPGEKIKVGGKEYDLKEGDDALNQMRKIAGLKECGMSPISSGASDMREEEGQMNISTNQSSDGTKSVTISASGDAASSLMQMLKLAGLGGQSHEAEPQGVMVVAQDSEEAPEQEMEEAKDERYHASTTPDEQVAPVQALTKGGNGDVAGQEKKMKPGGYQFGDNNHAMQESLSLQLMKEYNSIKVKK